MKASSLKMLKYPLAKEIRQAFVMKIVIRKKVYVRVVAGSRFSPFLMAYY